MTTYSLDPLYYTLAKTAAIKEAITSAIPAFIIKATDIENNHLRHHAINLIGNIEPLQSTYFRKHNLRSIAPIVKFLEQTCAMDEQFNNLPLVVQI